MLYIAVLISVTITLILLWALIHIIAQQNQSQQSRRPIPQLKTQPVNFSSNPTGKEGELRQELKRLVYGDNEMANRLIEQVRRNNPDCPFEWCTQKAIRDLEWDRKR